VDLANTTMGQDDVEARCEQGRIFRASGRLGLAEQAFREALAIDPAFAPAASGLGQTLYDLGRSSEALDFFEQALQAEPNNADLLCCCGQALADSGHNDLALEFLRRAIEAAPARLTYTLAAIGVLKTIEFVAEHAWYERFLVDCLDNPELDHDALTNAATSLLWIKPAMQRALAAERLGSNDLQDLAQEPLLLRLLTRTIVRSWPFEEFFISLRRSLADTQDRDHLALRAAVAEQAFNSGYVQFQSDVEIAREQELLRAGPASLTPAELMVLASYRALVDVPGAAELEGRSDLPQSIERVIERTLREPLREKEIQARIEALTPIEDEVSRRVQAQYEEHPYPRWIRIQSAGNRSGPLVEAIGRNSLIFDGTAWPARPQVLVPGCGTGYQPLLLAQRHPETDVLAVDLSLASLAYAIRKQQELEITNVRFCQADLLRLGETDERFDYIDCAGVLHHLASPLDGWRILTGLLEPGGVMRVGLYSELARTTIVAARERIAGTGIEGTPANIRKFRRAIMSEPELAELRGLARMTSDFFSMGGVRDLIFHEQEHRFDLPTIRQHLDALGLRFGGFLLSDRDVVRRFHASYPATDQWLDLGCWAEFEAEYPKTFYGMYQFYCLKA